jgi:hypothetical protein
MAVNLSPVGGVAAQFFTNTGAVLTGGKLYTYLAGTTTPTPTYTTSAGNVARTNPIILDSAGRVPSGGEIWLTVGITYKFVLTDSTDVLIGTYDNIPSQTTTDASLVTYTPAGTGAVTTNVQAKLRQYVSAKDFGAVGNGVADDTVAIQNAINATSALGQVLFIPAGTYKVTDTISMPRSTQISGEHVNTNAGGFGDLPLGTIINFAPTSPRSLFVSSGTYSGSFRSGYLIENLYIAGNSSSSTGNSIYAINAELITDGLFRNLAIAFFRTGIYVKSTINNRFEYVRVINAYEHCVLYDGGLATTDVWEQCYFSNAPVGVNTTDGGVALAIRFHKCIFETLTNYGVQLAKENFNWTFIDCYAEDVPAAGSPSIDAAMFKLGYRGSVDSGNPIAYIIGGFYGGDNSGSLKGYGIDSDDTSGVIVSSPFFTRYNFAIRATANTLDNSIVINGMNWTQQNGAVTGLTGKFQGYYATGAQNSGQIKQIASFGNSIFETLKSDVISPLTGTAVYTTPDATNDFGRIDARWKDFYAFSGYVVTTPDGTKNYRIAVNNAGTLTATLL